MEGFAHRFKNSKFASSSPADLFQKELGSILGDDGKQFYTGISVLHLSMKCWLEIDRPRLGLAV